MNNTQIKRLARIRLAGNWGNCIALSMMLLSFVTMITIGEIIIYKITSMTSQSYENYWDYLSAPNAMILLAFRVAAYYLLFVPELGNMRSIYINLSQGKSFIGTRWEVRHTSLRYYIKIILMQTLSLIYQLLLLTPLTVSVMGLLYYIDLCRQRITTSSLMMFMLCLVIAIIMLCLYIYFKIKLRLLPYIMVIRTDIGIIDAFILSMRLMKKNVIRYVFFQLSFLHYFILCLLVFPIFVVIPYYYMSVTVLCSSLVSNEAIEKYLSESKLRSESKFRSEKES